MSVPSSVAPSARLDELNRTGRTIFGTRSGVVLLSLVGSLLFTALCLYFLLRGYAILPMLAGVVFFGCFCVPAGIWQLTHREQLVVDHARGLSLASPKAVDGSGIQIAWEEFLDVAAVQMGRTTSTVLRLTPAAAQRCRHTGNPFPRVFGRFNRLMLGADTFSLPASLEDQDELRRLLESVIAQRQPTRPTSRVTDTTHQEGHPTP